MAQTAINGKVQIKAGTVDATRVDNTIIKGDGTGVYTTDQSMGSHKITNLTNGTNPQDAATVAQVDAARQGVMVKDPVRAATTANITLSGTQTIDGVALSSGERVLVKDQSTAQNNGIYVVASGAWARSMDADISAEVKGGMMMWVNEGTTNGDKQFILTTNDPITLGTTPLTFTLFAGGTSYTAGAGLALTGSTFDVTNTDTSITVGTDTVSVNLNTTGGLETSTGVRVKLDATTLSSSASGLKVASGGITGTELNSSVAGAALTGGGGSALAVAVSATGGIQITSDALEAKLDGSSLSVGTNGLKVNSAKWITRETIGGTINGSNTAFTLAAAPVAGSEHIYQNGLLLEAGGEDYSISGANLTWVVAPVAGDRLKASYMVP